MRRNRQKTRLEKNVTVLGAIALTVIVFAYLSQYVPDYLNSLSWETAQGEVILSELITVTDKDNDETYRAQVSYFYFVGDERYVAERVRFGDNIGSDNRGSAEKTLETYPTGKRVTVYYDPANPSNAVIERKPTLALTGLAIFGLLCVAFLVYVGINIARGKPL